MSHKLVDQILRSKTIPGKYKKTLVGWASFARNDGTNIFASKGVVGDRAGVSRWTMYRHIEVFLAKGILVPEGIHSYPNGHWTTIYKLDLDAVRNASWVEHDDAEALLQNATETTHRHCSKTPKSLCSKMPKTSVAKCDAKGDMKGERAQGSEARAASAESKEVREGASSPPARSMPVRSARSDSGVGQETQTPEPESVTLEPNPDYEPTSDEFIWYGAVAKDPMLDWWFIPNMGYLPKGRENWNMAEQSYRHCFAVDPNEPVPDSEVANTLAVLFALCTKYQHALKNGVEHPLSLFLRWNRENKKGKLVIRNGERLAKTYFSDDPNCARRQFELWLAQNNPAYNIPMPEAVGREAAEFEEDAATYTPCEECREFPCKCAEYETRAHA
jgi:hypothetical protein